MDICGMIKYSLGLSWNINMVYVRMTWENSIFFKNHLLTSFMLTSISSNLIIGLGWNFMMSLLTYFFIFG
jgi:hypothetical protein